MLFAGPYAAAKAPATTDRYHRTDDVVRALHSIAAICERIDERLAATPDPLGDTKPKPEAEGAGM
jgi:hypothetical protein